MRFVDPFYYPVLFSWLTEAWRLREGDIQVTKGESNERTHFSFTQACFLLCVCSLLKTNGTEKRHTPHGVSDSIRPPQPFPLPQSPGSQVRSSFQSCIVCLAPPAYSIEVLRSSERAASSAASSSRSGVLSPSSTRSATLVSWLFMRCSRLRLLLATFR